MSFDSLLVNVCTVERYTEGVADNYGNPTLTWASHLSSEPCRLMATTGKEVKIGAEIVIANYTLFLGDVDITEQDRVVIGSTTYEVLLVSDRQDSTGSHHKECFMVVSR